MTTVNPGLQDGSAATAESETAVDRHRAHGGAREGLPRDPSGAARRRPRRRRRADDARRRLRATACRRRCSPPMQQVGQQRVTGDTKVAVLRGRRLRAAIGPAIQIVTDQSAMLMDTVTVLLHRLGVAYTAIMNPVFRVRRDPAGGLLDVHPAAAPDAPRDGVDETWIHVQLSPTADRQGRRRGRRAAAQRARRRPAGGARLGGAQRRAGRLASQLDADREGHFPSYDRRDVAALLRWLADGHFVLLGYQRCSVEDGAATVDPASRLGVLRLRTDVLPQLTGAGRPAGAGAGDHAELPALRRAPAHRGGPRDPARPGRRRSSTGSSGCSPSPPRTRTCWRSR